MKYNTVLQKYKNYLTEDVVDDLYKSKEAIVAFENNEYKIVIPKTNKAIQYFSTDTNWNVSKNNGRIYVILHKPTNDRFVIQFDTETYIDQRNSKLNLGEFFKKHPTLFNAFVSTGRVMNATNGYAIKSNNNVAYYNNAGQLNRTNGPAVEGKNGTKVWYKNGKMHREDGPAAEFADGKKLYYLNGQQLSEKDFKQKTNQGDV